MFLHFVSDCTIDNVTYANGTKVPSPGPCEECHCRSSEVVCSMIKCKPNTSGCQVMQQANHCCPQYKCGIKELIVKQYDFFFVI